MARIKKGESFEKLAREKSQDPGSAVNGGDLNWFGKGRMVKPFEEACFKAKVGDWWVPCRLNLEYISSKLQVETVVS
jgi:Parvulin-like peptidyl-prolyl isomerase